jgi:UCH-binding domain
VPSTQQTDTELPAGLQAQLASISAGLPGGNAAARQDTLSLHDVLSRDVLTRILQMPGIGERLRPGIPENWEDDNSGIDEVVRSPQFQQVYASVGIRINSRRLLLCLPPYAQGSWLLFSNNSG